MATCCGVGDAVEENWVVPLLPPNTIPALSVSLRINVEDQHLTVASDHAEDQPEDRRSWNQERNSKKKIPTSSGEFTFKGLRKKKAKYIRTSDNTSPEFLYEMMIDQLQLRVPNLLISVTGGSRNFSMNPRLKDLFGKGLVKAAQSTEAWIITGGCHAGVMKLVGEAVRDFSMTSSSYRIVTIGIATWAIVYNSARMISKACALPAEYCLDVENQDGLPCLDNNHSHFILVDDWTQGICGGEIPLRTDLEQFISEQTVKGEGFQRLRSSRPGHVRVARKERKSRGFQRLRCPQPIHDTASRDERYGMGEGMKVPIMCLVLEGDPGTLDTIHRSMINNTPCVIVEGSGGVADIIAQVADMNPSKITIALIKEKLSHFSQDTFVEKQIIEWTKKVRPLPSLSAAEWTLGQSHKVRQFKRLRFSSITQERNSQERYKQHCSITQRAALPRNVACFTSDTQCEA
ncbi:transient receptor potential cation channel subfamily M member 2-like [Lissotriton helveticus]